MQSPNFTDSAADDSLVQVSLPEQQQNNPSRHVPSSGQPDASELSRSRRNDSQRTQSCPWASQYSRTISLIVVIGTLVALSCGLVSWAVLNRIDEVHRSRAQASVTGHANRAASAFGSRMYGYISTQELFSDVLAEAGVVEPLQYVELCAHMLARFSDDASLSSVALFEGASHSLRKEFEDSLADKWVSSSDPVNRSTFQIKRQVVAESGAAYYTRAENQLLYYVFTKNCNPETMSPPASDSLFSEWFHVHSRRRALFLSALTDEPAMTAPVFTALSRQTAYIVYIPVRASPTARTQRYIDTDDREFGWPDGFTVGLYVPASIVEDVMLALPSDQLYTVLLEDVSDKPEYFTDGVASLEILDRMHTAVDAKNFSQARRLLLDSEQGSSSLVGALYPCRRPPDEGFNRINSSITPPTGDVCVSGHGLGFGTGYYLGGSARVHTTSSITSTNVPDPSASTSVTEADARALVDTAGTDSFDADVIMRTFRVAFANRQLNIAIVKTGIRSEADEHTQTVALVVCVLISIVVTVTAAALIWMARSRQRARVQRRRVLIADASRLANEQATKYAVHELQTPRLAMQRIAETVKQALEAHTNEAFDYIARCMNLDVMTVHRVLTRSPNNDLHSGLEGLIRMSGCEFESEALEELYTIAVEVGLLLRNMADDINQIFDSGTALTRLTHDLLDLASLQRGEFKLNPKRTSLRRTMAALVNQHRSMAEVDLHLEPLPRALPTYIMIDPLRFAQVLSNGLTNACKLTREGSIYVAVRVEWPDEGDTWAEIAPVRFRRVSQGNTHHRIPQCAEPSDEMLSSSSGVGGTAQTESRVVAGASAGGSAPALGGQHPCDPKHPRIAYRCQTNPAHPPPAPRPNPHCTRVTAVAAQPSQTKSKCQVMWVQSLRPHMSAEPCCHLFEPTRPHPATLYSHRQLGPRYRRVSSLRWQVH